MKKILLVSLLLLSGGLSWGQNTSLKEDQSLLLQEAMTKFLADTARRIDPKELFDSSDISFMEKNGSLGKYYLLKHNVLCFDTSHYMTFSGEKVSQGYMLFQCSEVIFDIDGGGNILCGTFQFSNAFCDDGIYFPDNQKSKKENINYWLELFSQ
jgi:hypothetical protein